jgi:3-oxoacyl-[acyl-carrier-protein] synthase-1
MSQRGCTLETLGMITALGSTPSENWRNLVASQKSHLTPRDDLVLNDVRQFGAVSEPLPEVPAHLTPFDCRNNRLALAAYNTIRESVDAAVAKHGSHRVGVVMASSTAGVAEAEMAFRHLRQHGQLPAAFHLVQLEYGGLSEFVQELSGATGPCYAISTACSSGAKILAAARRLIDLGVCDSVIAGASDSLCQLTANGFHSLQALSKGTPNPMSSNRDGLVLGEAAVLFLVSGTTDGIQLLGVGESSDAHHISAPSPDGSGAQRAMSACLADGRLQATNVAYLGLHGTGTPQNDKMEAAAVNRVFGDQLPCSSLKPLFGHTLGAAGAVNAAICWLILDNRKGDELSLPPHIYDGEFDPELDPISLVAPGEVARVSGMAAVMSNSFGFGGSNCSLVLADAQP